ncbi:cadherin-like and PC-esterase domain-containing protein 1 [Gadus chalcogrammus]|uniref:cadherin-like and PC-esterase domain-containing protein 1 n=1 Tax=Gadus chalcogrammus TaxID=1042646 RepID=UPI0024C25A3D|nr:cadherin-like and PC-esterase domain-containing protein 1 [Gadus chalcogrammus]
MLLCARVWSRLWPLRRRPCSLPLLLVPAVCLLYHLLASGRSGSGPERPAPGPTGPPGVSGSSLDRLLEEVQRDGAGPLVDWLDNLERGRRQQVLGSGPVRAVVVLGQNSESDTEVQLYRRVLEQTGYDVSLVRYADRSVGLTTQQGACLWSVLACLRSSEKSCLWSVPFGRLQPHQMVNLIPELSDAFSDAGAGRCRFSTDPRLAGVQLPMMPSACGSTKTASPPEPTPLVSGPPSAPTSTAASPGLRAAVHVYVLLTSAVSLTAFLHERCLARGDGELWAQTTQLKEFLSRHLGPVRSDEALVQVRVVVGQVLRAAVWASPDSDHSGRCLLCYQLLTFTLHFTGTIVPTVAMINRDLSFAGLQDPFDGQITRETILEDTLHFLLPVMHGQAGGCEGGPARCLPEPQLLLMLQFHRQLRGSGPFDLVYPGGVPEGRLLPHQLRPSVRPPTGGVSPIQTLLLHLVQFYHLQRNHGNSSNQTESLSDLQRSQADSLPGRELCGDFQLRQLYTDPPLTLSPPFSPHLRAYRAEVPFHTLVVRVRPQPASGACRVHLDHHGGPGTAHYPVGLGDSRVQILLVDQGAGPGAEPVVMTTYTLHLFREGPPSLPLFGNHVMCGFIQDCGLVLQPEKPCGLEPVSGPPSLQTGSLDPPRPCTSGAEPGRWVVPCLSCADNRTCDWREVAWRPDDCYHPVVGRLHLQACLSGSKLLFIGDSTNRGIMYFLMERVNSTLQDWEKAHRTLLFGHLNQGRTHVGYSYYPQFWLEERARPTFQHALEQLLTRSRPLSNSQHTTLVVGGVQWLRTRHLQTIKEVLERGSLENVTVVIKTLGIGFHLPAHGLRSLSQREMQELHRENQAIVAEAQRLGYEVLDTFQITQGRYRDFLPGHCACHFHKVEKRVQAPGPLRARSGPPYGSNGTRASTGPPSGTGPQAPSPSYHVEGPVNAVYSEILLSRLCPGTPP